MKIRRLSIRNIASIERGDIDFEHDLIDNESGSPASLFLITGDTGSGKSVILDCISMALYGTTPRVKSVNGIRNNVYQNNNGEEISVSDITQYTRIGISWRDDCYAELSFEGNDGVSYSSRFSLGRTNRNNYRRPEWTLKIGDTSIIDNRKEEIKECIQNAVGLTFEQFSRMAMLAQGQFATFLTGKKEEREQILEQLTATDIFSRYGEAISNIFRASRQDYETSQKIYQQYSSNILEEESRQALLEEQAEKTSKSTKLQNETECIRKKIASTDEVLRLAKDISSLNEIAAKLKSEEESPEFIKRNKILSLWDETLAERELLTDKIKATTQLATTRHSLEEKKYELMSLASDLSVRKAEAEARTMLLEQQRSWIENQEPLKALYTESPAVISSLQHYINVEEDITKRVKEIDAHNAERAKLNVTVSSQKETVKLQNEKCLVCQTKIADAITKRDALKPSELREESDKKKSKQNTLTNLIVRLKALEDESLELENVKNDLKTLSKLFDTLKADANSASKESARLEKEKTLAESRYRTMRFSMDEKFEAIRRQLADEHAKNCPLCGQSIQEHLHEWENKEFFSSILAPLEEESNKCADAYSASKKKADKANKDMNTMAGKVKGKQEEIIKTEKKIATSKKEIDGILLSLELKYSDNISTYIDEEVSRLNTEIEVLAEKLKQTECLQKEINALLKEKETLDKRQKTEEKKLQDAQSALTKNEAEVKSALVREEELKKEKESLRLSISEALKGYADLWTDAPEETKLQLKKDADNYASKVNAYTKEAPAHENILRILDSIASVEVSLNTLYSQFEKSEAPIDVKGLKSLNIEELQQKWHSFEVEVMSLHDRLKDTEARIKELENKLDQYYRRSGKTETTLLALLEAAEEIPEIRTLQNQHRDRVRENGALLSEAKKSKEENLKNLGIEDEKDLEDIEILKASLNTLTTQQNELTQRLGAIKERLATDEKTQKESEKQKAELEKKYERMQKWEKMNSYFGGTRFRTLVQSHILRPLLHNANIYLRQITDHYTLTCSDKNEQLSILVRDRYHNNEPRSVTVLSGGERFMVSLALSLALSAMNRPDMNVDILFIDEGFGTLDAKSLDMVMSTLRRLPEINGQSGRRVGVISHREELTEQIDCQIQLHSYGEGRSRIEISN